MIELEFNEPDSKICDCCGQPIVSLTRYVYKDDFAFAVYYLNFTKGHSPKVAHGLIGLGAWGEDDGPNDRLAFPFKIWTTGIHYQVGLVDAEDSPWNHVTFLGQILNRDQGLQHEWIQEVFEITDCIVAKDEVLKDFFISPS